MRGKITIEIDFENGNEPVIELKIPNLPEDIRDSILKNFIEKWEHGEKRLFMSTHGDPEWRNGFKYFRIAWIEKEQDLLVNGLTKSQFLGAVQVASSQQTDGPI